MSDLGNYRNSEREKARNADLAQMSSAEQVFSAEVN
jgi:hypothetical protein